MAWSRFALNRTLKDCFLARSYLGTIFMIYRQHDALDLNMRVTKPRSQVGWIKRQRAYA